MLGIISINVGQDNSGMINEAIKAIRAYPDTIVAVSCGNELGHTAGLTSAVVSAVGQCVRQLKSAGISQPIGNIDTYYSWCNKNERECNNPWSAMANQVDWIGLNDYAYFSNIYSGIWPCTPPNRAAQQTMENHQRVMRLYQNKPVVLTETGWPTAPSGTTIMNTPNYVTGQQCGPANDANQKATVQSLINLYRSKQYPMNLFSAFKEAWKGATSQHIETQWGICDGTYPYTCKNQPN
jgi:exo-beta-1,3-glucanase (GH17 family)